MKKFGKILAMVMVALMMMSTVSFAAATLEDPSVDKENSIVTVTLTDLTVGEEATILVVKKDTNLATLKNDDIIYIDQLTAAGVSKEVEKTDEATGEVTKETVTVGEVTFTLDASAATAEENGSKYVDIYCGYTNMATTTPVSKASVEVKGADVTIMYGDVDGDEEITAADAGLVLSKSVNSQIVFPCGNDAVGNVDGDEEITAADAGLILSKSVNSQIVFPVEQKN